MKKLNKADKELLDSGKTKTIEFTITISGTATNPSEAWDEAVESFTMDPGQHEEEDISSVSLPDGDGWDEEED